MWRASGVPQLRHSAASIRVQDLRRIHDAGVWGLGLAQIGASEPTKRVITGTVIVAAVIADVYRHKLTWRTRGAR